MITSTHNQQVQSIARLRKRALREDRGRFLVEGAQPCEEALEAGAVETLLHVPEPRAREHPLVERARAAGAEVLAVSEQVMRHLTSTVTPQGVLAVARFVDVPLSEVLEPRLVAVLCAVRDPGNAGTVLRSADAAGADAVVFTESSVDVYNPKTVRASAGSLFHLPVVREAHVKETVEALRARGLQVLAASADAETDLHDADLSRPTAVLFGNEAWGLPEEVRALADGGVRVPIRGKAESLNLAASAAVILFEAARRRGSAGGGELTPAIAASAHDVRTSLTALKGFGSMLATRWDQLAENDRRMMVRGLSVDAERTAAMVKLLVDASRIEEGMFNPAPETCEVWNGIRWVAGVFGRSPDYPEVRVSGSAGARIDPDRLQPILLMIVEAAFALGGKEPVEMVAEAVGGRPSVLVARPGTSVPAGDVRGWLERPSRDVHGRFTLWLADRVARAQGAEIVVEGEHEAAFRLLLPKP